MFGWIEMFLLANHFKKFAHSQPEKIQMKFNYGGIPTISNPQGNRNGIERLWGFQIEKLKVFHILNFDKTEQ